MWVPSNHHVPPVEVSDLACQPPVLICVGAFQPSCAASRGIRPCMPAPHPKLCGCLPIIMCRQQRYQTLHASPPSQFVWVPSNHHVPPARVSDLARQPPILICVGTFPPSCAASTGIRPCMPAPHPNLCGCLPTIICCQQEYHTLHASPPPRFFQAPSASDGGGKRCMQYRRHPRKTARLLDFRAQFPSKISKRPPVPERRPTLHAISRALPQPWTTPKFASTSRTWSTMGHRFWPNKFGLGP